nr:unnamed protein product [Callosobruchus analis]
MNDLDRQLAELALINQADLAPNSIVGNSGKKVGPAVPPKPKKSQPQVPQSYSLKQNLEPRYASRIQTHQLYSNVPPQTAPQSCYANAPTLVSNAKFKDNNYANFPRDLDTASQYSNLPRSASAMSSASQTRQGYDTNTLPQGLTSQGEYIPTTCSLPRQTLNQNLGPRAYSKPEHVTYSNVQVPNQMRNRDGLVYSNLMHPPREVANVYSNLPPNSNAYANGDDLPPPPLDLTSGLADYAPCTVNTNLPPPPDDLLPPPSPVSSSYSELRRATQPGQEFHSYSIGSQPPDVDSSYGYGGMSQSSSTYESIYEPINPRPASQLSSRSNCSLYASTGGGGAQPQVRAGSRAGGAPPGGKEREVECLTEMLVRGMRGDAGADYNEEDVYGTCIKCGEKIIGENSGCTAMDQLYHTKCFTCHQCAINLQGKPFYALEGNPYCEEDYLNTLEKCCVCQKPILDRILRATGKPYHPKCFCCVVCGKSLDGIPFTVDATNQVHCIEDFHKIFAPRCWVCKQPIMPEPGEEETVRVVALDHSFHIQCYKCEDCGLVLSSEAEGRGCYPLDGHVLCKSCNAKRVQALTSHMTTEL